MSFSSCRRQGFASGVDGAEHAAHEIGLSYTPWKRSGRIFECPQSTDWIVLWATHGCFLAVWEKYTVWGSRGGFDWKWHAARSAMEIIPSAPSSLIRRALELRDMPDYRSAVSLTLELKLLLPDHTRSWHNINDLTLANQHLKQS